MNVRSINLDDETQLDKLLGFFKCVLKITFLDFFLTKTISFYDISGLIYDKLSNPLNIYLQRERIGIPYIDPKEMLIDNVYKQKPSTSYCQKLKKANRK